MRTQFDLFSVTPNLFSQRRFEARFINRMDHPLALMNSGLYSRRVRVYIEDAGFPKSFRGMFAPYPQLNVEGGIRTSRVLADIAYRAF